MNNIVVRRDGDRWGAFVNTKCIVKSACKPCVVKALIAVTKTSDRYDTITIQDEEGKVVEVIPTGAASGR